jgi:hypothetical protein
VTHPLLETLNDDQQALIKIIGQPIVADQPLDRFGWPVWDFIKRRFERNRPSLSAENVLGSLPAVQRPWDSLSGAYGLWWRNEHPNAPLKPADRLGLTIPGLHHLTEHLDASIRVLPRPVDLILELLEDAAEEEAALDSEDWSEVMHGTLSLRQLMGGTDDLPVGIIGTVLRHEYTPLAFDGTASNFQLLLGNGRYAPFRGVADVADYLSRLAVPAIEGRVQLPTSPLALPAALDYLGLVLANQEHWERKRRLVRLPDFVSASLVTQAPSSAAEYEQQLSALWTVICDFDLPQADPAKYRERGWADNRGSINSLEIWLADLVPEFAGSDQCAAAIRMIRNVGTLRQGVQHSGAGTRTKALQAQIEFGLPPVITDFQAAWAAVLETLAAAFYSISIGVKLGTAV